MRHAEVVAIQLGHKDPGLGAERRGNYADELAVLQIALPKYINKFKSSSCLGGP